MEKISINSFGGIDKLEIELNQINVFIGKQASGKSITAKLIYFFKRVPFLIFEGANEEITRSQLIKKLQAVFLEYFPIETWSENNFEILYKYNEQYVIVNRTHKKLNIHLSEFWLKLLVTTKKNIRQEKITEERKDRVSPTRSRSNVENKFISNLNKELGDGNLLNPVFVPAGRSFYANLQSSIFSFLSSSKVSMDPFLIEFGSFYENIKNIYPRSILFQDNRNLSEVADAFIYDILGSKYVREKNKDYLVHADNRKINITFSSSGQQETLPLLLILKSLLSIGFFGNGSAMMIEEPEAHLFPIAQKNIVEFIGFIFNHSRRKSQFLITTHSPYVLASINNLLLASQVIESNPKKNAAKVQKIIPKSSLISPQSINAYAFIDGKAISIIDSNTGILDADYLDSISQNIAIEFESLLNIE